MKKVFALVAVVSVCLVLPAQAINYGSGTYGSCQYNTCSITLSSSGTVSLNVVPTTAGSCTTQADTVSVLTDDSNGFALTLAGSSASTGLTGPSGTINATGGTFASPIPLANSWGYRVDGAGGFGAGPTSAQSNAATSLAAFAGPVPSTGTPDTILAYPGAADPALNTSVWYGVCATTSVNSGTYTSGVTYTAITND